jgi:hypothetical protein
MARTIREDKTPEGYFERAQKLWRNAAQRLRAVKVVDGWMRSPKQVREACGTAWLAVEEAIKGLARRRGEVVRKLPREIDQLGAELARAHLDGSLRADLHQAYWALHIGGYYEGIRSAKEILDGLKAAGRVVERVTGRKMSPPA